MDECLGSLTGSAGGHTLNNMRRLFGWGLLFSLWAVAAAQEPPHISTNSISQKAAALLAAGDRQEACRYAQEAVRQNPSDEGALGLVQLSCTNRQPNIKFQGLKIQRHQVDTTEAAPQPQEAPLTAPAGPGIAKIPLVTPGRLLDATSYDKTRQAQDAINRGRFEEAAAAAQTAISLEPSNVQAYVLAAESFRLLGQTEMSLKAAEDGLRLQPQNVPLLKNKIAALIARQDFEGAVQAANAALKVNTTDALIHVLKAYALGRTGDRYGMIGSLRTASSLDPAFESLFIEAQNSKEGSVSPFTLPGQAVVEPEIKTAKRDPKNKLKSRLLFLALLMVLIVVGVLLAQSLLTYFGRQSEETNP